MTPLPIETQRLLHVRHVVMLNKYSPVADASRLVE